MPRLFGQVFAAARCVSLAYRQIGQRVKKKKFPDRHFDESGNFLDIAWYPERASFIRRNTHKYKYKFFSYKKVAPKVAPFFIRCGTGGVILLICTHLHNEGQE